MPVYIRKGPLEIPPGSEKEWTNEEEEDYFLKDPEKAVDCLPQPYRTIDKELDRLIDRAWEIITIKEQNREAEKLKTKIIVHEPTNEIHVTKRVNCMASGKSGPYLFVGLSEGLAVYRASDLQWICGWEAPKIDICSLEVCHVKNELYLIAAVDDMGVARLIILSDGKLSVLKVINEPEDFNKRVNCVHCEIADGGDYAGLLLEGSQECWLEVYKLPKDSWLKELESSQMSSDTAPCPETRFTPPILLMKIKPPKPLTGCSFRSVQEAVQKSEDSCMFGSGQNHIISAQQWDQQEAIFTGMFQKYFDLENLQTANGERSRYSSFHFLQSSKMSPGEPGRIQAGLLNVIGVHWNGNQNLFLYLLGAPVKDKSDVDPKPDIVWPCAATIRCSAVSFSSYLALGLEDGTLTIWDLKYSGFPLATVALPEGKSIGSLHFLECPTANRHCSPTPRAQLLVCCADKSLYLITAGGDTATSLAHLQLSPGDANEQVSAVVPLHSLPNVVLLFYRSGMMQLMDISLQETVCQFSLPLSHWVAFPWQPVCSFDSENLCLFLKGNEKIAAGEVMAAGDGACSLFVFNLKCLQLMNAFRSSPYASVSSAQSLHWEEMCKLLLQQRFESLPEQTKKMSECWSRLRKRAATLIH
uniref:WD repeat domain 93 n=1 Tax=Leptobrachium leishanense TaxID=445787 RepID=A0A8C5M9I9_9ANUR